MYSVRKMLEIDDIHKYFTGESVSIVIMDTGIAPHPDVEKRVIGFYDFVNKKQRMYDDNGHGTHIAGICVGSGQLSGGKYKGICPGANIIGVKVLDNKGHGKEENVIRASEWVLNHKEQYNINVVNISFGTSESSALNTEMIRAIEAMWDQGIAVVAAAGNNGPETGTITSPGISTKIITVGALDDDRRVYVNGRYVKEYSGRGESGYPIKPDLVAPATMIKSCNYKWNLKKYVAKSGTSMSTPIVSGCIALYLSKYEDGNNTDIKTQLLNTCVDRKMPKNRQGYGMINPKKFMNIF